MWISITFQRLQYGVGILVENFMKLTYLYPANRRFTLQIILPALITCCCAFKTAGQTAGIILLPDQPFSFKSPEFYIAAVDDERPSRYSVASLVAGNTGQKTHIINTDLQGGAAAAIKHFTDVHVPADPEAIPVTLQLKTFGLTENAANGATINGIMTVSVSFNRQFTNHITHLVDYEGSISYTRSLNQPAPTIIRQGLENSLAYLNKWVKREAASNIGLARKVKVNFKDHEDNTDGDTLYYTGNRPLVWADFKDIPRVNRFEAEVFTGIAYAEQVEVVNGTININIDLKTYLSKNDCWVRDGARSDFTLNHEQRHFDIAMLAAEHFKQKISAFELPVDDYDGRINVEYLETLREAYRTQKQYDEETQHGTIATVQDEWDKKIDGELKSYGISKKIPQTL